MMRNIVRFFVAFSSVSVIVFSIAYMHLGKDLLDAVAISSLQALVAQNVVLLLASWLEKE